MRRIRPFLYRRLARWITCEVRLLGAHPLALDSKFQVNSLQDVFCHPFYWQLFGWLPSAPKLVVDLGAHCGHFSMLADVCFRAERGGARPEYVLVEPNPELVAVISTNLRRSRLCPNHSVSQGLVGAFRQGSDTLWVCPQNFLSASLHRERGTRAIQVDYLDLDALVGNRAIDLLKVDIEGAEYEFARAYPDLLRRAKAMVIEIHDQPEKRVEAIHRAFEEAGLQLRSKPLRNGGATLAMYQREGCARATA
jgi:FkbM family methyltransferase